MRRLVGPLDDESYENLGGELVYSYLPPEVYQSVFDFGCGCGRFARQLLLQEPRPRRYVGIDLHRGMIAWCQRNLAPRATGFTFEHHDVFNLSLNPDGAKRTLPFPIEGEAFTLVHAWSVFTHLVESQTPHYLRESARILRADGVFHTTWFLFDKREFPMMQESANALYINDIDPTAAVIYDREWVRQVAREAGLTLVDARPPSIRGYHWVLMFARSEAGRREAKLPADQAPLGIARPPLMPENASRIGLDHV